MILYCIGIDYRHTSLAVREQAYRRREEIVRFFREYNVEAVALFTCNRIEVYAFAFDAICLRQTLSEARSRFKGFFEKAYVYSGLNAMLRHALRLAVGLCSQIRGEPQIMLQLQNWLRQEDFSAPLKKIWLLILARAVYIRRNSGIEQKATNIAQVVLSDLEQKLKHKQPKEILIVGSGKIAELFVQEKPDNVILHFAARKRYSKAQHLARQSGGEALFLKDIGGKIEGIDAIVSATASPHYIIKKDMVSAAIKQRQRPLYIYDLAVPRDIEPEIAAIPQVVLRNLDGLSELLAEYNKLLAPYSENAMRLIESELSNIEGAVYAYDHYRGRAAVAACA